MLRTLLLEYRLAHMPVRCNGSKNYASQDCKLTDEQIRVPALLVASESFLTHCIIYLYLRPCVHVVWRNVSVTSIYEPCTTLVQFLRLDNRS